MKMRKGQEEAVGFVAIIIIVALALVFFIGISVRNAEPQNVKSVSVKQFLESSSKFTTSCDLGMREKYANTQQLLEECYKNPQSSCLNGVLACQAYNRSMGLLLEKVWSPGEERLVKEYSFNVSYDKLESSTQIVSFFNGSCEGNFMSEETLSPDSFGGGTFVSELRICT